ncbi:ABC-2 transporter permease [Lederbergia wuyishanensis]|uniref:ABC-2 transporter permease n=1 Tax=Lederbergia wuyishanensis TaxID=1347903 RepID=A0ABU0D7F8_9BACI|nr:ABC-2 transporter permease [Lederbergia wuyishanensis]MCJ8009026.1 ABC-2 transporter permease [Lederbergia wuyishanensis]MDQ0344358.1 hypothetical protein [Lederbergia wuyishanensis]
MKTLILKDLYTQKLFGYCFPALLLFPFFINAINATGDLGFVSIYVAFAAIWMSAYSNFGTIALNKRDQKLITSLPITRKKMVQAKYFAAIIWWGIGLSTYGTLAFLILVWWTDSINYSGVTDLILSLFITLIVISLFYPLYFLVGYQIAVAIAISIPMIGFFTISMIHTFSNVASGEMFGPIIPTDRPLIFISIVFSSIIITFCSYKLSVKIFEKKDL